LALEKISPFSHNGIACVARKGEGVWALLQEGYPEIQLFEQSGSFSSKALWYSVMDDLF
jgi:hypothetical protein